MYKKKTIPILNFWLSLKKGYTLFSLSYNHFSYEPLLSLLPGPKSKGYTDELKAVKICIHHLYKL